MIPGRCPTGRGRRLKKLAPIRRVMPDTRPMDFSALALIVLLQILAYLLEGVARSTYAA